MLIPRNRNHQPARLASAVALATMALAVDVAAQLEEVIVTAERRENTLQDTPIAVTAFSEEKIADMGIFTVADIGGRAPNTNIGKQPSSSANMSIFIRGVGQGETSVMIDPKTSFYVDGVYMSKTVGAVFDIVDLERIEVLRGPQGTLFGRNSTGGAINVTTVKPRGELAATLQGSIGNDGYQRVAGSVDLPQFADMLSVKLSAAWQEYDGWAENTAPDAAEKDFDTEDNKGYRAAFRLAPTDSFTVDYAYDKTDNSMVPKPWQVSRVHDSLTNGIDRVPVPYELIGGELYQQMAADIGDPDERRDTFYYENTGEQELDVEGHSLTLAWDLELFTLKYIFADRETEITAGDQPLGGGTYYATDLIWGDLNPDAGFGVPVPKDAFNAYIEETSIELTTHEFQIIGDAFNERLQYTGGFFSYEEEVYESNPQTFALPIALLIGSFPPPLPGLYQAFGYCDADLFCIGSQRLPFLDPTGQADPNNNGFVDFIYGQDTESWAVYSQVTWSLTNSIDLTGGIRYTEDDKEAFLFNENFGQTSVEEKITAEDDWDNTSYLARVNWAMNDDINFYFTWSTGYNGGGFNARASNPDSFQTPFDEEDIESFEVGMKSDWFDNRMRANIAIFYNEYTDIQIAQFEAGSGGASSAIVNAGEATYQGLELDFSAILFEGLIMEFNYGYLDAEFDEYLARDPATNELVDISGNTTVPRAPEHSGSLSFQYDFQPFEFGELSARVDLRYTDEYVYHPFNNQWDYTESHTMVDGRISLNNVGIGEEGTLRFSLWGKNLTDEEHRVWGIDFDSLGYAGGTYARPRTYGLDIIYDFR
jgi:iron complex outermembrane receptor protein